MMLTFELMSLIVTAFINLGTLSYVAGTTLTRIRVVEKEIDLINCELRSFREVKEDIAVIKTQLLALSDKFSSNSKESKHQ